MNNHSWIENELLLQCVCVWIDVDCCVSIKVWLNNLRLIKRIIKEPDHTHWTSADRVAEETSYELLGERCHLGTAWNA